MKTLVELRKEASELGIKNYAKYSKEDLSVLIANQKGVIEEKETTPNLPSLIYSNDILVVKEEKKVKKTRKASYDIPDWGTQSRKIYDYIEEHLFDASFTVYKVCQVLGTPSNNTRRIYFKFFAQKKEEAQLQLHLEEMDAKVGEPMVF